MLTKLEQTKTKTQTKNMKTSKTLRNFLALSLLVVAVAAQAKTITLEQPVISGGGPYTFSYDAALDNGVVTSSTANGTQAFIEIRGIEGYVAGSAVFVTGTGTWTPVVTAGPGTTTTIRYSYTAGPNQADGDGANGVTIALGSARFQSTLNVVYSPPDNYTTRDQNANNNNGSTSGGSVNVPGGNRVPDGGFTASLLGLSMLGLSWARRFVKRA